MMVCSRSFLLLAVGYCLLCTGWAQVTESAEDAKSAPQLSNIKKVMDKLFKEQQYDKQIRPITHHSNTTVVFMSMAPKCIVDLIEDRSMLMLDSLLILHWNDFRLSWNPDDYHGLKTINVPDHMVWQPDIRVYNSYSWNVNPMRNTHLLIHHNGDVLTVPPAFTTSYCLMENVVGTYPYDKIECPIIFGCWTQDGWQVDLMVYDQRLYMDDFIDTNPRWSLLQDQVNITREVNHFNCCEEPYVSVHVRLPMLRRYPPELKVTWSPCVLVMALTLVMFFIRPDSGKKLVLGSVLLLMLIILIVYVGVKTRSQYSALKAVSFLSSTLYAVVAAVILEIIVITISSIEGSTRPPEAIVNLLSGPVGRNIAIYARWLDGTAADKMQLREDSEQVISHPSAKDEWMLVGAAIDRVLFVVFIVVFSAIHRI